MWILKTNFVFQNESKGKEWKKYFKIIPENLKEEKLSADDQAVL